jgi:hypothetical protein
MWNFNRTKTFSSTNFDKKFVAYPQKDFKDYLKYFIVHLSVKKYVKYLKRRGASTEFVDSTQKHHKTIGLPNQSIRMKIFPKKYV